MENKEDFKKIMDDLNEMLVHPAQTREDAARQDQRLSEIRAIMERKMAQLPLPVQAMFRALAKQAAKDIIREVFPGRIIHVAPLNNATGSGDALEDALSPTLLNAIEQALRGSAGGNVIIIRPIEDEERHGH